MQHHAYSCTFPEGCNCGASYVNSLETELTNLRAEVSRLRSDAERKDCRVISHRINGGEAWLWQGDGDDHLESLTCPVVIRPEQLRSIITDRYSLAEIEAACGDEIGMVVRKDVTKRRAAIDAAKA